MEREKISRRGAVKAGAAGLVGMAIPAVAAAQEGDGDSDGNKATLEKQLKRYCIEIRDVEPGDLVVPCRSIVSLSLSPRNPSSHRPTVLQTSDLDELKSWIGVDDRVVKGRCFAPRSDRRQLREILHSRKAEAVSKSTRTTEIEAIRSHARSYVYGDSTLVKEAKPAIEGHFGSFQVPLWVYRKVTVKSGSALVFGPGANVLVASELEIEEGGRVISHGSLKVDVRTLRKTVPGVKFPELLLENVISDLFGR